MTLRQTARCCLGLLLLFGTLAAPGGAGEYDFSAATRQMADNLDLYGGNVLVVVQQGDRVIFRFQAGTTMEDTKYGLASCSKWLSGAVILRMHEKGLFKFEDAIGGYLPVFNDNSNENGVAGAVTIQQCCSMKSGLYATGTNPEISRFLTLEQSVNKIASDIPLAFVPGTKLAYEGCGLQTVGRICEVVDPQHRDWRTIAADELFTPLGMENCDYNYFGTRNPAIAGGAQGTAQAYLRFLQTIMNGGVTPNGQLYLRPRSMRRFLVNQTRDLPEHATPCPDPPEIYPNNTKPDYGTASWIMVDDPNYPQSKEAIEVASPGAFGTWPWIDRQRNLRGIVYMYDNLFGGRKVFQNNLKVVQAVRDAIDAVGEPAKPRAVIAASAVSGRAPLTVNFDASGSTDPEGDALTCVWDFGNTAVLGRQISRTFTEPGAYDVLLNVTDCKGTYAMAAVTINVGAPNTAPVAAPQSVSTAEDTALTIALTGSDADGDPLSFVVVTPPAYGTLSGSVPNMTYTPEPDFHGADSFTFKVNDGTVDSATANVAINITPVNDAPVISGLSPAGDVTVTVGSSQTFSVQASDVDGDALSYTWKVDGTTVLGAEDAMNYSPAVADAGTHLVSVTVSDGSCAISKTWTVTVPMPNRAPAANSQNVTTAEDTAKAVTLTGSDADGDALTFAIVTGPAHGSLSGSGASRTYTPAADYNGSDSFTFKVSDGQLESAPATVSITVTPVNDAPVAESQSVTTTRGTAVEITLGGSDIEGSPLVYTVLTAPTRGTLSGTAPNLVYKPSGLFVGDDSFTFKVNDGQLDSAPASVSIQVIKRWGN